MADEKPTNPKDLLGTAKPAIHLIPPVAIIQTSEAMRDGAIKYGAYNWRDKGVKSTVYISAALRHLLAYLDREEVATDSGVHHLAHAMACCAILLDAISLGNMVDDRPLPAGHAGTIIQRITKERERKDADPRVC